VALATLAIFPLEQLAPVVSLSVVYLPAVLLVSTYWGAVLGLVAALLSAAAFNFFHLPPTGEFTIADSRNWVALAAFVVVALVASTIADLARARAQEAEPPRGGSGGGPGPRAAPGPGHRRRAGQHRAAGRRGARAELGGDRRRSGRARRVTLAGEAVHLTPSSSRCWPSWRATAAACSPTAIC
jgi:hypothetical protein